jgi:hypothetical protein
MKHPLRFVRDDVPAPRGVDCCTILGCAVLLVVVFVAGFVLLTVFEALR